MEAISLKVPTRFGGQLSPKVLYIATCPACGDFGTIALDGQERGLFIAEIRRAEVPCTCKAGDIWRRIFHEWSRPVLRKGARRMPAVTIDPLPTRPSPVAVPQPVKQEAQRMLASIGGK